MKNQKKVSKMLSKLGSGYEIVARLVKLVSFSNGHPRAGERSWRWTKSIKHDVRSIDSFPPSQHVQIYHGSIQVLELKLQIICPTNRDC